MGDLVFNSYLKKLANPRFQGDNGTVPIKDLLKVAMDYIDNNQDLVHGDLYSLAISVSKALMTEYPGNHPDVHPASFLLGYILKAIAVGNEVTLKVKYTEPSDKNMAEYLSDMANIAATGLKKSSELYSEMAEDARKAAEELVKHDGRGKDESDPDEDDDL